jgi:hypothetical protein
VPPRRVQEILIVTFTKAATEELRGRIRKRLRADARGLRGGRPAARRCGDRGAARGERRPRRRTAERLRLAEMELDLASLFTIHGFASRMLNRNAFESRISFAAQTLGERRGRWSPRPSATSGASAPIRCRRCRPHCCSRSTTATKFVAAVRRLLGKQGLELRNVPAQDWDGDAGADGGRRGRRCWPGGAPAPPPRAKRSPAPR